MNSFSVSEANWIDHSGGLLEIGNSGKKFCFDSERPKHKIWLEPFCLAKHLVSNREYLGFVEDGGYHKPELWLSDGWALCRRTSSLCT